jgi:3-oxoadipate enol-lactonase
VPTARVNGIRVYYEHAGEGPRVIFLNGSGTSIASSGPLIDAFRGRFEVVVHDQRGLGETDIPPGPYTMQDYAVDALGLLDAIGWESCRVFGVSFGGMVALELAVTAPGRVERLAVACTSPGGAGGASYPLHELEALDADERGALASRLLDTRFDGDWLAAHPADRALVEQLAARGREKSDEQRRGEREQLLARRGHDVTARLDRIACPTLVAAGRYDGIAPVPNSEAIASRVRGADLRVYEGGHIFFAQDPRALPEIFDFLAA